MQETVTVDAELFNMLMVVMYGIFSLMAIVVGAYIALFKRSIESKMDAGFSSMHSEMQHINRDVGTLFSQHEKIQDRLNNYITSGKTCE